MIHNLRENWFYYMLTTLILLVAFGTGFLIFWILSDRDSHQEDRAIYVVDKDISTTHITTCNKVPGTDVQNCTTNPVTSYTLYYGDEGEMEVFNSSLWQTFQTGVRYNVRVCGQRFPIICENLGVVQ
jgi:hypothetical protein